MEWEPPAALAGAPLPADEWAPPATPGRIAGAPRLTLSASPTLRAGVFFGLYIVQGIPSGFALTAVFNYLVARGLDARTTGNLAALIGIPWSIQFVWGPLIDRFQGSPMGRRKPWVLGAQFAAFLASLGVVAVADPATQIRAFSIAFVIHALFASVQDASVDAMAISIIPKSERGRINACMRAGIMVGTGVGAYVWGHLIRSAGFTAAALAQSAVLLAMTVLTAFIREQPGDSLVPWGRRRRSIPVATDPEPTADRVEHPSIGHVFRELALGFFVPRTLLIFAVVILVYTGMAVFIQAYPRYLIGVLGWSDTETSTYEGIGGTAVGLATALVGFVVADRLGPRRLMVAIMALIGGYLIALGLLGRFWGTPGLAAAALVAWYVFDPGFSVACMPVLMGVCRRGVEGSQFTAYMALVNLANAGGQVLSSRAQGSYSVPTIGLVTGLVIVAAIPAAIAALRDPRPAPRPAPAPAD